MTSATYTNRNKTESFGVLLPGSKRSDLGFTLLELLLALTLLGIVLALTIPRVGAIRADYLRQETAREFESFIQITRMSAVRNRAVTVLTLSEDKKGLEVRQDENFGWDHDEYGIPVERQFTQEYILTIPVQERFSISGTIDLEIGNLGLIFFPGGPSSGGSIILNDEAGNSFYRCYIDPTTSQVFSQHLGQEA